MTTSTINTFELNDNNTMSVQEFESVAGLLSNNTIDNTSAINVYDLDTPVMPKRSVKAGSIVRAFLNDSRLNDLAGVKDIATLV